MLSSPCCVYILQSIPPCLIVISLCNRCVNLQLLRQSYVVPRQAYKILFLLSPLFSSSPQSMFAYKQPISALMILSELATRAPTRSKNRRVVASIKRSFDSRGCRDLCHPDFRNRTYSIGRAWPFPGPSPRGCNGLPICVTRAVARHEGVITVQMSVRCLLSNAAMSKIEAFLEDPPCL